jgi:hypothetical protein
VTAGAAYEVLFRGSIDITGTTLHVTSQRAQKNISETAIIVPMPNWTTVKINRLETSKRSFRFCKALVRQHNLVRIHALGCHARANHVQSIHGHRGDNYRGVNQLLTTDNRDSTVAAIVIRNL